MVSKIKIKVKVINIIIAHIIGAMWGIENYFLK